MAKQRGAVSGKKTKVDRWVVDGGQGLSEERRTASPSIRTVVAQRDSHKDTYLAPDDCLG